VPLRRPGGRLELRGVTLQRFWPLSAAPAPPARGDAPLAGVDADGVGAQLRLEGCLLVAPLTLDALTAASPFWEAAAVAGQLVGVSDGAPLAVGGGQGGGSVQLAAVGTASQEPDGGAGGAGASAGEGRGGAAPLPRGARVGQR
jgi:hypothetical protein